MISFQDALKRLGVTERQVNDAIAEQGVAEIGLRGTVVKPSPIHGNGLFAERDYAPNQFIVPVRLNGTVTHLGAASNHGEPNAELVRFPNSNLYLRAITRIRPGDEILHDYTTAVWSAQEEPAL